MKKMKKLIVLNAGVLILASMLVYPIFAKDMVVGEKTALTQEEYQSEEKAIVGKGNALYKTIRSTNSQSRLTVGQEFTDKIYNNGIQDLDCKFKVLTEATDEKPGTVEVGSDCIDYDNTVGTIAFPDEVSDGTDRYIITAIGNGAFNACQKITSTGLENNTTITVIGRGAFAYCIGITSTGLEKNNTVTTLESLAFSSTGITSTGLENNTTVTSIKDFAFENCHYLSSTGLENNATVTSIGRYIFDNCNIPGDLVFAITTLPSIDAEAFSSSGIGTIYYPANTTNPEVLNGLIGVSVKEIVLDKLELKTSPQKIAYIEGQVFNPEGLTLLATYNYGNKDIVYSDSSKDNFNFDKNELRVGDKSVAITYQGKTVTQAITVKEKKLLSIDIKTEPDKIHYIEEENFDPSGLIITASYDNGKSESITYNDSTKDDFSFNLTEIKIGDNSVNINYKGISVVQNIYVDAKAMNSLIIKMKPNKVEYQEGEEFNPEGLVLEAMYNNGSKEEVVYEESTKEMFSFDKRVLQIEDTSITIRYGEKTVEQKIRVVATSALETIIPKQPTVEFPKEKSKEVIPITGDNTEIEMYCLMGGIGLLVIVGSVKRRKEN